MRIHRAMPCGSTAAVITLLLAMALISGAATAQPHGGAGSASQDVTPGRQALYNEQDLHFLRHMIIHHQQALEMSGLVPTRTDRPELIRFAGYVARAQAAEIDYMQSLLDLAVSRGQELPHHGPHGDPPMAGMLSSAQMEAMAAASGPEFERLWLEGMIYHHQGALDMAQAQQLQQLEHRRRPYGIDVLVEEIIDEQRAEIATMRGWLEDWGLVGDP